jgi:hypothetical protein
VEEFLSWFPSYDREEILDNLKEIVAGYVKQLYLYQNLL